MGTFPQKFFPRLTVTFAAYPGIDKADVPDVKFLDNEKMIGSIPAIIADTIAAVRRNMRTGGVMDGIKRVDVPELTSADLLHPEAPAVSSTLDQVYDYIKDCGPCFASQASQALGIPRSTFNYRVNKLIEAGYVERLGATRSKNQQYVITAVR